MAFECQEIEGLITGTCLLTTYQVR